MRCKICKIATLNLDHVILSKSLFDIDHVEVILLLSLFILFSSVNIIIIIMVNFNNKNQTKQNKIMTVKYCFNKILPALIIELLLCPYIQIYEHALINESI